MLLLAAAKQVGLRLVPEGLGKLHDGISTRGKGKTFEKIGIHLIRKKTQLS